MATTIILPPLELLDAAAAHLVNLAADASHERTLNKALWNLQAGLEIRSTTGGFLMPSGTRAGVIHRISTTFGCNCEAAAKVTCAGTPQQSPFWRKPRSSPGPPCRRCDP
jgi:hypothetical protein